MENLSAPRMIISSLITPATIELELKGLQRDEVLAQLVAKVPHLADRPEAQKTLLRALQEREQLCSTGVGEGVAFPHSRNALVGLVDQPVVVFGRHLPGIPFGALDEIPAKLFFLLVAPTVGQHLQILARLNRLLRNPQLRKGLLIAESPERASTLIRNAEAEL